MLISGGPLMMTKAGGPVDPYGPDVSGGDISGWSAVNATIDSATQFTNTANGGILLNIGTGTFLVELTYGITDTSRAVSLRDAASAGAAGSTVLDDIRVSSDPSPTVYSSEVTLTQAWIYIRATGAQANTVTELSIRPRL